MPDPVGSDPHSTPVHHAVHKQEQGQPIDNTPCSIVPEEVDIITFTSPSVQEDYHHIDEQPVHTVMTSPTYYVQQHYIVQRVSTKSTSEDQPSSLPSPLPSASSTSSFESSKILSNTAPTDPHSLVIGEPAAAERKHWSMDRFDLANAAASAVMTKNTSPRTRSSMDAQRPSSSLLFPGERRCSLGNVPTSLLMATTASRGRGGEQEGNPNTMGTGESHLHEASLGYNRAQSLQQSSCGHSSAADRAGCPWVLPPIPDFSDLSLRFDKSRTNSTNMEFLEYRHSGQLRHLEVSNGDHHAQGSSSQPHPLQQQHTLKEQEQEQESKQQPEQLQHPHAPSHAPLHNPREGGARSHSLTSMNGIRINMDSNGWHCSVDDSQVPAWDDATMLPPDIVPEYLPEIFDQLQSDENEGYIIWNTTPAEPMTPGLLSGNTAGQPPNSATTATTTASASSSSGAAHQHGSSTVGQDKGSSATKRWSVGDQFKSKDFSTGNTTTTAATTSESSNRNGSRSSGDGHGLSVQVSGSASLRSSENVPPTTPKTIFKGRSGSEALLSLGGSKSTDATGTSTGGGSNSSGGAVESTEDRTLMAATVEKLVEKLTSVIDYTFLTDFFLIYRLFITPLALLKLLILRFHWALLDDTPERQIVRIRTFVTLRHWLLNYFGHDFMTSKELRKTLTSYLNSLPSHPRIAASPRDQRIVKELKKYTHSLKKIHYRNIAQQRLERKSRRDALRQQRRQSAASAGAAAGSSRRSKKSRAERAQLTQSMSTTDDLMPSSQAWVDSPADRKSKAEKRKMSVQMVTSLPTTFPGSDGGAATAATTTNTTTAAALSMAAESGQPGLGIYETSSTHRHSHVSEPLTEELTIDFRSSEQEDDDDDEEEEDEEEDDSELDDTTEDDEIEPSTEESQYLSDLMYSSEESDQDYDDENDDEERVGVEHRQAEEGYYEDRYGYEDEDEGDAQYQHHEPPLASTPVDHDGGYYPSSPAFSRGVTNHLDSPGGKGSYSSHHSTSYRSSRPGIPSFDSPGQPQQRSANRVSTAWSRTMRVHTHESMSNLRDRRTASMALTQDLFVPPSALTPNGGGSSSGHVYLLPSGGGGSQVSAMDSVRSVEPYMNPPPRAHVNREKKKTWARYMSATVGRLSRMKRALTSGSLSSNGHKNGGGGFGNTSNSSTSSRYRGGGGSSFKDSITDPMGSSTSQARLFKHFQSQYSDPDNDKVSRTNYFLGSCSAIQFVSSSTPSNQFVRSGAATAGHHHRSYGNGGGRGHGSIRRQHPHDGGVWSSDEDYSQYEMTPHSHSLRSTSSSQYHHQQYQYHHQQGYNREVSGYDGSSVDRESSSLHSQNSRQWQQPTTPDHIYVDPMAREEYECDDCSECEKQQQLQQGQQYGDYRYKHRFQGQGESSGMVQSTSAPIMVRSDDEIEYQFHSQHRHNTSIHPLDGPGQATRANQEEGEDRNENAHEPADLFHDQYQQRHSLDNPRGAFIDHHQYLAESGDQVGDVIHPASSSMTRANGPSRQLRRTTRGRPRDSRRASWRTLSSTNSSMFGALLSEGHRPPGQTVLERLQDHPVGNIDKFVEKLNLGQGFTLPQETSSAPTTPRQTHFDYSHPHSPQGQSGQYSAPPRQMAQFNPEQSQGHEDASTSLVAPQAQPTPPPPPPPPPSEPEPEVQKQPTRRRSSWILDNILMHHSLSSKGSTETITNAKVSSSAAKRNSTSSKASTPKCTTPTPLSGSERAKSPSLFQTMTRAQKRQTMPVPLLYQHRHRNAFMGGGDPNDGTAASAEGPSSRRHSSDVPSSERWGLFPILNSGWHNSQQQQQQQQAQHQQSSPSSNALPKMIPDTATLRPVAPAHAPLTSLEALPEHLTLRQVLSLHPDDLMQDDQALLPNDGHYGPTGARQGSQPISHALRSKPSSPLLSTSTKGQQLQQQQQPSTASTPTPAKRPTAGQKRSTSQPHLLTRSQLAAAADVPVLMNRHSHHPSMPVQGSGGWYQQQHASPSHTPTYYEMERRGSTPTPILRCEHTSTPLYQQPSVAPMVLTTTTEHYRNQRYQYQRYEMAPPPLTSSPAVAARPSRPTSFVLRYRTELIAQQLCLIERELLNNVQWYELVDAGWTRKSSPPQTQTSSTRGSSSLGANGAAPSSSSLSSIKPSNRRRQQQQQQRHANTMPARSVSSATTDTTASSSSNVVAGGGGGAAGDDLSKRYSRTRKRSASEGGLVASNRSHDNGNGKGRRASGAHIEATAAATVGGTPAVLSIAPIRSRRHPKNPSEESQGIKALIDRFNLTCQWVTTEILNTRDLDERVRVVEKFIRIAQTCYNHSNFSSLIQLILGLQSHNVSRLTKTWARVRPKEILMMQDLIEFTSPFNNWKHLRDTMKNIADEWGGSGTSTVGTTTATGATVNASDNNVAHSSSTSNGRRAKSNRSFFGMKTGGGGSGSTGGQSNQKGKMSSAADPSASMPSGQEKANEERTVKQGGCIPFLGLYLSDLVYNTELPSYVEPRGPPVQLAMCKPAAATSVTARPPPPPPPPPTNGVADPTVSGLPTPTNSPLSKTIPMQKTWASSATAMKMSATSGVSGQQPDGEDGDNNNDDDDNEEVDNNNNSNNNIDKSNNNNEKLGVSREQELHQQQTAKAPQKLINFHKHRTTATIIKRVLTFRTIAARYPFRQEPEVYAQLLAIRGMDLAEMERASLLCEERISDANRAV
ncbi:hypothetical protein BGW41_006921 [Actinomortierella wolfii]|nr:hypothetical protein BGW41_006921 [Actinomortierella wolfii]